MNDQKDLYTGISRAAWGYFFLYIDFNLGTVSVFPAFAGYLLFLSAIELLSVKRRELTLLRTFAILLALWHGIAWLMSWAGASLDGRFIPLDLMVTVINLYFHFQLLTGLAALAGEHPSGEELERRILKWRTLQALSTTVTVMVLRLPIASGEYREDLLIVLTILALIVAFGLMLTLFSFRRFVRNNALTGSLPM